MFVRTATVMVTLPWVGGGGGEGDEATDRFGRQSVGTQSVQENTPWLYKNCTYFLNAPCTGWAKNKITKEIALINSWFRSS